jgi:hypothetical protein
MAEDVPGERAQIGSTLAEKYRAFLVGLSDTELALYCSSIGLSEADDAETLGFAFDTASLQSKIGVPEMRMVFQDVTVNKLSIESKAPNAREG